MLLLVHLLFVFKQNRRNRSFETEKPQQREEKNFIANVKEARPPKKKGKQNESIYFFPNVKLLKLSSSNAPQSAGALDAG
jgi:predicted nucleotide-binding protein